MFLALIMSKYEKKIDLSQRFAGHFRYGILYPVLVIGSLCGLVMLEKHLSGLIIIGLLGLTVMWLGGADRKWMGAIIVCGILAVLVVLLFSDYAQERVLTWLFLDAADLGADDLDAVAFQHFDHGFHVPDRIGPVHTDIVIQFNIKRKITDFDFLHNNNSFLFTYPNMQAGFIIHTPACFVNTFVKFATK